MKEHRSALPQAQFEAGTGKVSGRPIHAPCRRSYVGNYQRGAVRTSVLLAALVVLPLTGLACSTINSRMHYRAHSAELVKDGDVSDEAIHESTRQYLPLPDQFVYGGVVNDTLLLKGILVSKDGQEILSLIFGGPLLLADIGLCAVADTIMLPVTGFQQEEFDSQLKNDELERSRAEQEAQAAPSAEPRIVAEDHIRSAHDGGPQSIASDPAMPDEESQP